MNDPVYVGIDIKATMIRGFQNQRGSRSEFSHLKQALSVQAVLCAGLGRTNPETATDGLRNQDNASEIARPLAQISLESNPLPATFIYGGPLCRK